MKISIYGLFDPIAPQAIRYVGQSANLVDRFRQHSSGGDKQTRPWVKAVKKMGRPIAIKLLEETEPAKAKERETFWISQYPPGTLINVKACGSERKPFHISELVGEIVPMREILYLYAQWAVDTFGGNKKAAALALGIARQTLYHYLRKNLNRKKLPSRQP